MKRLFLITLLINFALMMVSCSPTSDEETGIVVENVRANMTLPSDTGSFWMSITNHSDTDDALIGAEVDGCGVIELHDMVMENDVMIMRQVEGGQIPVAVGETVELAPGGLHVMCLQKEAPLELGSEITVKLEFANEGILEVEGTVVEPAMGGSSMDNESDN